MSTGGSAARIESLGIPVTKVEDLTGFPECLDGRVKTLHPKVHAGILADRRLESHVAAARGPRHRAVRPGGLQPLPVPPDGRVGRDPRRVRRADRHRRAVDGSRRRQEPPVRGHRHLARSVRRRARGRGRGRVHARAAATAGRRGVRAHRGVRRGGGVVDGRRCWRRRRDESCFPEFGGATFTKVADLRYGENPHQPAALYADGSDAGLAAARAAARQGDVLQQLRRHRRRATRGRGHFDEPAVAIIKHANPCGIAVGADIAEAHRLAHECDPTSAFGGVIATNRPVSVAMAEQVAEVFTEVIVAPAYDDGAVEVLQGRKNLRILVCDGPEEESGFEFRHGLRRRAPAAGRPRRRPGRRPGDVDARRRAAPPTRRPWPTWPSPGRRAGR